MALVNGMGYDGLGDLAGFGSFLKKVGSKALSAAKYVFPVAYVANYALVKAAGGGGGAPPPPPPPSASLAPPPPPPPLTASGYNNVQPLSSGQYLVPPDYLNPPMTVPASGTPSWLLPAAAAGGALVLVLLLTKKKSA